MALLAARALARLVALLLSAALAVAGLAVAVFSIQGASARLSLPGLAGLVHLGDLRSRVGTFLTALQAGGPVAKVAALAGAAAVVLGLVLLFGVLARRREHLVVLSSDDDGTIAAQPRAISQAAVTLGEQSPEVLQTKASTSARRHGSGGRLRVTVAQAQSADAAAVSAVTAASLARVQALAEPFSLRVNIRGRVARPGARRGRLARRGVRLR